MKKILLFILISFTLFAQSETFPPSGTRPVVSDFISSPSDTFYCSPTGDNTTGDGSIGNPWVDLIGADGNCGAGDLIYFRGGTYPSYAYVNFSRSQNRLTDAGAAGNAIVITNYPGETVVYNSTDTTWCLTLGGDYQKLIGTMNGSNYGIQITGGVSFHNSDYLQISNVEFIAGGYNGGDNNPAGISDPLNTYTNDSLIVSYNYFHDFENPGDPALTNRMVCVRFFATRNSIVEYNVFEDNLDLYQGGAIYYKDWTEDTIIRYNKFINCQGGIGYNVQANHFEGADIYNNLSYGCTYFIYFISEHGNADEINIYGNTVLNLTSGFYYYLNSDGDTYTVDETIYDNVIDGLCLVEGWHANSSVLTNIPDYFDYNLHYAAADTNTPSGWSIPDAYYNNSIVSNNAVTYNSSTQTATVAVDYAGRNAGRYGDNIGGFTFTGADETPPTSVRNLSSVDNGDSIRYVYSSPSSDNDTTIIKYGTSNPPSTVIDTLLGTATIDTTLDGTNGYNYFSTYMVDDSSNSITYTDSLNLTEVVQDVSTVADVDTVYGE